MQTLRGSRSSSSIIISLGSIVGLRRMSSASPQNRNFHLVSACPRADETSDVLSSNMSSLSAILAAVTSADAFASHPLPADTALPALLAENGLDIPPHTSATASANATDEQLIVR